MNFEYTCKKKKYDLNNVKEAQILLLNGDFVNLSKEEILSFDVVLYDKLIPFNNSYFPVAKSGFIKFKISDKKVKYDDSSVCDKKEYSNNRKAYIEKLCFEEGVFAIRLFDDLNWHDTIFGNIIAKKEDDFLIFSFLEYPALGSADSDNHFINLKKVNKKDIRVLHLDFENCDGIDVFQNEIKEFNLNFKKELSWNGDGYVRVVKNGYLRIKFDKNYDYARKKDLYVKNGTIKLKHLEKRIYGKGEDDIDICNLYISNTYCGYGLGKEEVITLSDLSEYPENYDEIDNDVFIPYISGYAQKQKDGSILITFGKKRK